MYQGKFIYNIIATTFDNTRSFSLSMDATLEDKDLESAIAEAVRNGTTVAAPEKPSFMVTVPDNRVSSVTSTETKQQYLSTVHMSSTKSGATS